MSDTTTATLQSLFESYLATGDSAALQHHLARESRLPGPRANLELARAFAETAGAMAAISAPHVWALVQRLTSLSATDAPTNSPDEFIPFCGAWAAGEVGVIGHYHQPPSAGERRNRHTRHERSPAHVAHKRAPGRCGPSAAGLRSDRGGAPLRGAAPQCVPQQPENPVWHSLRISPLSTIPSQPFEIVERRLALRCQFNRIFVSQLI